MKIHPAFAAVGGFLWGLAVGGIIRPTPPDVAKWEARVAAYQKDSLAFERALAVLHGERARLDDSVRTLNAALKVAVAKADVAAGDKRAAKHRADSLTAALATKASAADSLPVVVQALEVRTAQADAAEKEVAQLRAGLGNAVQETLVLRGVINTQDSVIATVTKRLAVADELLRNRPVVKRCSLICPSPTTTFILGAALGAVGGIYVATR